MDQILGDLIEEKRDVQEQKTLATDALRQEEERKVNAGKDVIIEALKNKKKRASSDDENSDSSPSRGRRLL